MGRLRSINFLIAMMYVFFGGCTTKEQRQAFQEWVEQAHAAYQMDEQDTAFGDSKVVAQLRPAELGTHATVDEYLAYAAKHNPGLEAAFHRWKAALERMPQVQSLPDPRFNYVYFIENVETRVGPQRQRVGISQAFPWFGKLGLRGGVALEAARVAQARYEAQKLRLFFVIKKAYYEYYYLGRAIAVVRENRELVKYLEGVARVRFKAAEASHPDVIRAQVELGKLDDQLRSLEDLQGTVVARLNAAMNRPIHEPLPWPKQIAEENFSVEQDQLMAWLGESNPELRALRHGIAQQRESILLARKDYYPDLTVGVDYIDTGDGVNPGVSDSGNDPVSVGVSINMPLWHQRYDAGVREAVAKFGAATKTHMDRENELASDLKMATYLFSDAGRKIDLYRDTLVPKAQQAIKATDAAFRAGRALFIDLIDAQRVLLQFELEYERALADSAIRLAQIELLVGRELPRQGETP